MKYHFKPKQVVMEIKHCLNRYMDEKMPGYDPCVDLTSDPRSLVAALLINQYYPKRAHVVYVEDRVNDRVDEDVIVLVEKKLGDRFHKIDTNECESYRSCLDAFTYDDPMRQFGAHMNLKYLYETSLFPRFVFIEYTDTLQINMGYNTTWGDTRIPIFHSLTFDEIAKIGKALKLEKDFLLSLYEKSDMIRTHEKIINASLLELEKDMRGEENKLSESILSLVDKYGKNILVPAHIQPIRINITAFYDLIE